MSYTTTHAPAKYIHHYPSACRDLYGDPVFKRNTYYSARQVALKGFCTFRTMATTGEKEFYCFNNKSENAQALCDKHYEELTNPPLDK